MCVLYRSGGMATLSSTAHVSTNPFSSLAPPPSQPIKLAANAKKLPRVRCASSPSNWRESRRLVSISLSLDAVAGSPFDKYVKRKKLDPLEAYVSPVILTQLQIKDLEKSLEGDEPQFATCRSLLRSGPAASLRVNIRAVAQYASDDGNGKTASSSVDQCLRALEELDSLLLHASRKEQASVKSMKAQINTALGALDSLLKTVPSDVLDKGKVAADSYRSSLENADVDISDPDLKQLESIL
ncbi:Hypothetical predicted protein [Prunus dulcis]|uniref:DUF7880 domain-containing protein n=1 Tax=Prunus dulcis TaxID=3755 RepID=A0A5E4EAF6_PRUDU|nr:uncharacterized protein LOC117614149 isoform X2 [Prunus dulcis]VVA11721.1 Hypothetical predicted protein [Prunus dulcis]